MNTILITLGISFAIAFILGILLGFFKKVFHVPVDPKIEAIRAALPGANCGACGFPGCDGFAAAVAEGTAPVDGCAAGGKDTAEAVGKVMGVSASAVPQVILLACQGSKEHAQNRGIYNGVKTCLAAKTTVNGTKLCSYGCIGFGDCVAACRFEALTMAEDGLPHVDYTKCTGCGMCAQVCPQKLFSKVPADRKGAVALCSNRTTNKTSVIKNCKVGCIKCLKCEKACEFDAIYVIDGVPVVDYDKCTSCNTCVEGCPTHVLTLVQNTVTVQR